MHGLPKDFPYGSMVGARLTQVCVGENDLQLHFDTGASLFVESSINLTGADYSDFADVATPLANLLGRPVTDCGPDGDRRLILAFDEVRLAINDDSNRYESFRLRSSGREFIV